MRRGYVRKEVAIQVEELIVMLPHNRDVDSGHLHPGKITCSCTGDYLTPFFMIYVYKSDWFIVIWQYDDISSYTGYLVYLFSHVFMPTNIGGDIKLSDHFSVI